MRSTPAVCAVALVLLTLVLFVFDLPDALSAAVQVGWAAALGVLLWLGATALRSKIRARLLDLVADGPGGRDEVRDLDVHHGEGRVPQQRPRP
ncbi:hypothetical protein DNL40_00885 [Xylanimonas oleitrophica]|uniref:Uncharacterized protein n=1 Tax=Xylanimonas oleitrophica TaxID=2607479 RepID=A0A2W5WUN9_9MICO|nr:hypothetical protein [Xylanimonas oleitrophica]PZR54987.1 hypothetical protein DNL40_00885 [Xylanimonas oleitrophica]